MTDRTNGRSCDRCGDRAVMMLMGVSGGRQPVPDAQALCPDCIPTEVRVLDARGFVPVGEYLGGPA